ncbi:MAG: hypothetical protein ACFFG0_10455 [Candidatus Thorarchaeota archaeon]
MTKDLIFQCKKCGHRYYTTDARKLVGKDCESCGEDWEGNYILLREGDYEKEHGN